MFRHRWCFTACLCLCIGGGAVQVAHARSKRPEVIATIGDAKRPIKSPRAVVVDEKHNEIYVADSDADKVRVYDMAGMEKGSFRVASPLGLAMSPSEKLHVISNDDTAVLLYDRVGNRVGEVSITGLPYTDKPVFARIAIDAKGRIYLADIMKKVVVVTGSTGKYLLHFGALKETDRGIHFASVSGIWVKGDRLCVADGQAAKVYLFNLKGKLKFKFGKRGGTTGMLAMPGAAVINSKGQFLVLDRRRHGISVFDEDGIFLGEFGGQGGSPGWFYYPDFMTIDSQDRIYVCEPKLHRVQVLRCDIAPREEGSGKEKKASSSTRVKHLRTIGGYGPSMAFKGPLAVCVARSGKELAVADTGNNLLSIFSADGMPIKQVGKSAGLKDPLGVAFGRGGTLYVSTMDSPSVLVLDAAGSVQERIDLSQYEGTANVKPGRMALDGKGNLYVIDRAACQVLVVGPDRKLLRRFGTKGDSPDEIGMAQDVAVDAAGRVFVTSSLGTAVHVFDSKGTRQWGFGKHGNKQADVSFPIGLAIDAGGRVWLVDSFQHSVKVFSSRGKFLFRWGTAGRREGELLFPVDIDIGPSGTVYVVEKGTNRVQAFHVEHGEGEKTGIRSPERTGRQNMEFRPLAAALGTARGTAPPHRGERSH